MAHLSRREKKKKEQDELQRKFGEDISKRPKGVSRREWISSRTQEEKTGNLPKQIKARQEQARIEAARLTPEEKDQADQFISNFQQNLMTGGMSRNPVNPVFQNPILDAAQKKQADDYANQVQIAQNAIAELPHEVSRQDAEKHLQDKGIDTSEGTVANQVVSMTFQTPQDYQESQRHIINQQRIKAANAANVQRQTEAEIANDLTGGFTNQVAIGAKAVGEVGKGLWEDVKRVGAAGVDVAERGPWNPYEGIRNTVAGIKAAQGKTGKDWESAYQSGFYNDKARETHWEKTTGKKLFKDDGNIDWQNAREFIGSAMEAPTFAYSGGRAFSEKLVGGLLSRTGQRAVANLPFAAVNTAIQAVEKGKSIADTIKELPKDFLQNEAMLTAFSTVFGELGRYKAQNKKLPKIEEIKPEQDIKSQLDDYIAGKHPEANPEAFSLANRPGRQGQVSPARTSPKETAPRQSSKTPQPGNNGNFDYTNNAYNPNIEQPAKNVKSRGFLQTVARSKETTPELAKNVRGKQGYTPKTNAEIEKNAIDFVKTEPKQAENFVHNSTDPNEAADITATGIQLIKRYQGEGDHETAGRIAESVAEKLTGWGQGIQAAKLYENLSPEGVMIRVKKAIKQANAEKWFWQKDYSLTDETAKKMFDLAKARQGAVDPTLKAELSSQLGEMLGQFHRASLGQQVSLAQTEAQLLNPKTHIRNTVGNEIMYRVERLNKYVSTPIDWTRSKLTGGDRTITFKTARQGEYWKNFLTGATEAWHGNRLEATQFDIPKQTFKSKWNPLYWGEKVLGASLQGFDHAAFSRAKNQTIGELAYLRGMNEGLKGKALKNAAVKYAKDTDKNILKIAEDYGKYVTFQDDNLLSRGFIQIKRGLNFGKDFGVGDLVLKYPKTPGAIMMRGIEYSPAGFLKSAYEVAHPILRGKAPNTREATLALGRAITGTLGLSGLGYYLADKGIITGRPSKDKDVRATEKQQGLGSYQINLSALKRWVLSGFNDKEANLREGDIHYSYDWAQPLAMSISMGANLNENLKEKQGVGALGVAATGLESAMSGAQTLAEQPLVSGLTRLFGYGDVVGGITNTIQGLPSSFTPSFLNQVNQWADNKSRETYDPDYLKETGNLVKARLPFLAQTLPEKINTEGEPTQRYQNNNWFNIFFNPGFVTKFESTPESKLVLDLYNTTGETKQFPKVVSKTVQDENGNTIQLEPQQVEDLQKYVGQRTKDAFTKLAGSKEFTGMSEVDQVDALSKLLTAIGADAKKEVLGIGQGSGKSDEAVMKYMDMKGLSDTDFNKEVEKLKDQGGNDTIVTALKIYRTNDNARSLGLDTKDDWSQMSISDRNRYLQDKFKNQTDQQKTDLMKKMVDKGIAVDPTKYLNREQSEDFLNSLTKDQYTKYKTLRATEETQERESQGLPGKQQEMINDYQNDLGGMELKDRYRYVVEHYKDDTQRMTAYKKQLVQDVYDEYKGKEPPAWVQAVRANDSSFSRQLNAIIKKGKNTNTENDLAAMGVENRERADAIWEEIKNLPVDEQRNRLIDLENKKILTTTVFRQLQYIRAHQ